MKVAIGKENEIPELSLDFSSKPKPKPKPNTDRSLKTPSELRKSVDLNSKTISLLQKKKQYSQALRQKNVQRNNTQTSQEKGVPSSMSSSVILRESTNVTIPNESFFSELSCQLEENSAKPKEGFREKTKGKKMSMAISSFDPNTSTKMETEGYAAKAKQVKANLFGPSTKGRNKKAFSIVRSESLTVGPFETDSKQQLEMLQKQNGTFKRELAAFRKENGSLKRELEQVKKQLQGANEHSEQLVAQHEEQMKMVESLNIAALAPSQSKPISHADFDFENVGQLKEILRGYEGQLFEARALTKNLQFRNYMLEKRLADEEAVHRKQMAKEIGAWKERYIKARNENLRLKDKRNSVLFDMSTSQQM